MPTSEEKENPETISPTVLLSGRLLKRNVVWNFTGAALPLAFALYAIPVLIHGMGKERFGLLMIIWMGVGYFSLFDLGIGRALTKLVAERLGDGRDTEIPGLLRTGSTLMAGLGLLAAGLLWLLTPWLTSSVFNVPKSLIFEAEWSFWVMSGTVPFVISSAGLIGVLQAHQRFFHISAVRIPLGVSNFLGPVLLLVFTPSLIAVTAVLALTRVAAWVAFRLLCRRFYKSDTKLSRFDRKNVKSLMSFGGWITISNIIGPLMLYFDRFLIGAVLSLTAVAYYTTPYEIITRLWIVPEALAGVLFPALATALVADPKRAKAIFHSASNVLLIAMYLPIALTILFAYEGLTVWINKEFAQNSAPVLQWLALGVYINCLARLPFAALQGKGRPDLTAILHALELPIYFVCLWVMLHKFGILGAAISWTIRIVLDTLLLFLLNLKFVPVLKTVSLLSLGFTSVAAIGLSLLWLPNDFGLKILLAASITAAVLAIGCYQLRLLKQPLTSKSLAESNERNERVSGY